MTPDNSPHGWTPIPDPTTLTTEAVSKATTEYRRELVQLKEFMELRVNSLQSMLDERYATQTKALDAAFRAAEQAVAVALANAEKATIKAETAADKRFDAVNEFRQVLTDQTATFMPRSEYDTAHAALVDRITIQTERMAALELRLTSRLDIGQGTDEGGYRQRTDQRAGVAQMLQILTIVALAAGLVITILLHG
jgi:hypothetical protein